MSRRNYRKKPLSLVAFAELEKRFGWLPEHAAGLVARPRNRKSLTPKRRQLSAANSLRALAKEYLNWFKREPNKIHLFPLAGTFLQYEFAKGVRDGAGLKVRIHTIIPLKGKTEEIELGRLKPQAQALRLKEHGIVLHDSMITERTKNIVASAAGIERKEVKVHRLNSSQTEPVATVPISGDMKQIALSHIAQKRADPDTEMPRFSFVTVLYSRDKIMFIRRAVYAAGVAAAKELLKKQQH